MTIKATFQVNPNLKLEQDCGNVDDLFQFVASMSSILGVRKCGNCQSPDIVPKFRTTREGYQYRSMYCNSCGHELNIKQNKTSKEFYIKGGWVPPFRKEDAPQPYTDEHDVQDAPPLRRASPVSSGSEIEF